MSTTPVKTLTLLRHGLSTANFEGIAQGQKDYPLHPQGVKQVERLVKYWQRTEEAFDRIITSPLQRARETARMIGSTLSIPITEDPVWLERNFGEGEGLTYDQIELRFANNQVRWSNFDPVFPNSESESDLIERAADGIQAILQEEHTRVLVVSHGGILNATLRMLLEIPLRRDGIRPPGFAFENTGFTRISYYNTPTRWVINFHNATPHLE